MTSQKTCCDLDGNAHGTREQQFPSGGTVGSTPFRLCGMCNTYPLAWHASGWRCSKYGASVTASTEACVDWTQREGWKPEPPMYSRLRERDIRQEILERDAAPKLPQPKPCPVVYFIRCGEFIKIGYSSKLRERVSNIATSTPHKVELLGAISGGQKMERDMHKRFARCRHSREWFKPDAAMEVEIVNLCRKRNRNR